jgi:iron(III) transport system substrate-binding protein
VPGHDGVFLIPNSLVRIKGGPNPAEAQELIDYLLSEEVEAALALERGAQIPVRAGIPGPPALETLDPSRVLAVDWESVADALADSSATLDKLLGPEGAE